MRRPVLMAVLFAASGAALGAPAGGSRPEIDANGDGAISREEAQAIPRVEKNFDAMDANKDGQVSKDEARRYDRPEKDAGRSATQRQ